MKRIAKLAKEQGVEVSTTEGGKHTIVTVGQRRTTVPRHSEINELTARGILKYLAEGDQK